MIEECCSMPAVSTCKCVVLRKDTDASDKSSSLACQTPIKVQLPALTIKKDPVVALCALSIYSIHTNLGWQPPGPP